MLQIESFIFLITTSCNFQQITHDRRTKKKSLNLQCHPNYFLFLEVLDLAEGNVLPSLITDIAEYMALKALHDKISDVRLKQHSSLNNITLMKIFSYLFLFTKR